MPEEPAELQPLLLAEAKHVLPGDAGRVQLALRGLPDVPEVCLLEEAGEDLVGEVGEQGAVPDGVGHLLAERALEEVGPLRQEEDVLGPGAAEARAPRAGRRRRAVEERPELAQDPEQRGLPDAARAHDQAALAGVQPQGDVVEEEALAVWGVDVYVVENDARGGAHWDDLGMAQLADAVIRHAAEGLLLIHQGTGGTGELVAQGRPALRPARFEDVELVHDLQQVDHALEHGPGLGEVHDVLGDLHAAADDADKGEVEYVEGRLRVLRPGALAHDKGRNDGGDGGKPEVKGELHQVHGKLPGGEEPEGGPDPRGPALEVPRLRRFARVEADALREEPAARVRRTQRRLAAAPAPL